MKKFVILSYRRSGSTMLYTLLNSHPHIRCHGELFLMRKPKEDNFYNFCLNSSLNKKLIYYSPFRGYLIRQFLSFIFIKQGEEKAVGFKLMYKQAKIFPSILQWIKKNNVKIIHLHRQNILKIFLSIKAAQQRGTRHSAEKTFVEKISIDSSKVLCELISIARRLKFMDLFCSLYFPRSSCKDVYYEEFLSDMEEVSKQLLGFLGVDSNILLKTELKKLNPNHVRDIVTNYEILKTALKGTYFEQFLD